jgi:maleate cis-trans isomerase
LDNTVLEWEYQRCIPEGVSIHVLRLDSLDRTKMLKQADELACASQAFGPSALLYACAETSFFKGQAATVQLEERLSESAGCPVVSATGALLEALRHLDVARLAVATPYRADRGQQLVDFLTAMGFKNDAQVHRWFDHEVQDDREWWGVNIQHPEAAYRLGRQAVRQALDAGNSPEALVIAATNFRTFEIIELLERDTGLPVVTSNQALLWAGLRKAGIGDSFQLGQLFARN